MKKWLCMLTVLMLMLSALALAEEKEYASIQLDQEEYTLKEGKCTLTGTAEIGSAIHLSISNSDGSKQQTENKSISETKVNISLTHNTVVGVDGEGKWSFEFDAKAGDYSALKMEDLFLYGKYSMENGEWVQIGKVKLIGLLDAVKTPEPTATPAAEENKTEEAEPAGDQAKKQVDEEVYAEVKGELPIAGAKLIQGHYRVQIKTEMPNTDFVLKVTDKSNNLIQTDIAQVTSDEQGWIDVEVDGVFRPGHIIVAMVEEKIYGKCEVSPEWNVQSVEMAQPQKEINGAFVWFEGVNEIILVVLGAVFLFAFGVLTAVRIGGKYHSNRGKGVA